MEAPTQSDTETFHAKARPVACQVPGCSADLSTEQKAAYCIKRRLCRQHMQADAVQRNGFDHAIWWRFCFQCGKLETISCFEAQQRSCKSSLKHRRRVAASSRHRSEDNSDSSGSGGQQQQRCNSLPCPLVSGNSSFSTTSSGREKPRRRSFAELEAEMCRRSIPQQQQQQQQELSSCFAQEQVQGLMSFNSMGRPGATEAWPPGMECNPSSSWMGSIINTASAGPAAAPVAQQLHGASSGEHNNNGSSRGASNSAGLGFGAVTAAAELASTFCSSHEAGGMAAASAHACWSAGIAPDCSAIELGAERLLQQLLADIDACGLLRPDNSSVAQPSPAAEAPRSAGSLSEVELVALIEQELQAASGGTAAAQAFSQQQWAAAGPVPAPVASLPVAPDCQPAPAPALPEVELLDDPALEDLRAQLGLLHLKSMQLQQLLASAQAPQAGAAGFGGAACLGTQHQPQTFGSFGSFAGFF